MHHVSVEMEEFYQKNNNVLEKRKNDFKYFERQQEKLLFPNTLTWNQKINQCIISFSLINRYTGMRDECSKEGYGWILLGIDYDTEVGKLEEPLSITGFGHALSDVTRLNILREIHQNGEQTLTDLSRTFDLVNAVMLYHLDILRQERLLGQRHEGRRVYYWLNYSQLKRAILAILSEFGGELNENMEKAFFGNSKP